MAGVNKATIIGHLGGDPEIRTTQDGRKIGSFSMATSETWKDKETGEKKERTEWHRVSVFNENLVEVVEKYVKKGHLLYVEGQLATRKWTDKDNIERYTTEIVLRGFSDKIQLLEKSNSTRPPGADSADDYGQTRTVDRSGGDYGSASGGASRPPSTEHRNSYGNEPANFSRDMDDDIPF